MDRGEEGVLATMDFWDTLPGVHYLGISRSEEYGTPLIIERNSIRVGFLSFTYGTNGIPLPGEKPFLVSLIDPGRMAGSLDKLRPLCDYMAVSLHWGKEYEGEPDPAQESLARLLAEHGADLIIGHHPHVLQKVALFPRPGGGTTCCVYSLGNFFAFQETPLPDILLGGLLLVRLKKTEGRTTVDSLGIIPLISHGEEGAAGAAVYPLHEYTGDLFEKHRLRGINKELSLEYFLSLARKRLGPYLLSGGDSPGR
jgi:poly-gamma-glutamate synthesis protein (capsule biosynthesis protein)